MLSPFVKLYKLHSPHPSGPDDTFLDSNKAQYRECCGGDGGDEAEESRQTYRDDAPFHCHRTPLDISFDRAMPSARSSICRDPSGLDNAFIDSRIEQVSLLNVQYAIREKKKSSPSGLTMILPLSLSAAPNSTHVALRLVKIL